MLFIFLNCAQYIINIHDTFFLSLNIKESKTKYIVHQVHGQRTQIRRKKKQTMIWTLETMIKCPCYAFFKIMFNTLLISVTHFFCSLNIKESKKTYIVHKFHGQRPQISITKSRKTMIWTLETMFKCPYYAFL